MARKGYINYFFKPFYLKKRTKLLKDQLTADCLWTTDIVTKSLYLKQFIYNWKSLSKSKSVSENAWGHHLHIREKGVGPRIELCGAQYFNVLDSEKKFSTNQQFSIW